MKILFNGQVIHVESSLDIPLTLSKFFNKYTDMSGANIQQSVAAINMNFIHKEDYDSCELKADDSIELLTAVVGG